MILALLLAQVYGSIQMVAPSGEIIGIFEEFPDVERQWERYPADVNTEEFRNDCRRCDKCKPLTDALEKYARDHESGMKINFVWKNKVRSRYDFEYLLEEILNS